MSTQAKLRSTGAVRVVERSKRRRHPLRTALLVLLAAAILIAAAAGTYLFSLGRAYDSQAKVIDNPFPSESNRPQPRSAAPSGVTPAEGTGTGAAAGPAAGPAAAAPAQAPGGQALNILVMGSDSRGATVGKAESGSSSDQRADTLMLVHIPADRSKIFAISLMRDLWVDIPGHGRAKINSALAYGGVPLMVQTVETMFNERVDHVAMVDFEGFVGLTDALGGVEVDIPRSFVSAHDKFSYQQGRTLLDGKHALEFVRERYSFTDGDYQRVRNQQAFVRALFAKNLSPETLLNPVKVHNVVTAMSPFISVDSGLNAAALANLALELRNVRADDMEMFTLPTLGIGTSADGQSIVLPNQTAIKDIGDALAGDSLDNYVANNGLPDGH
ncbi:MULTISPECIES: LCP family protein [unclassified Arthrobacter]|uniref:LCP family protein n=1 Tax=unclassified Arthrobacter TaxID=235627 RepID=UPI001EF10520|nr:MULTISPECIES: LCP family protein [unclassified Arthrobacter]UKA70387.1 LCP family protein [Arthrobacter sp. FW306-06-A]UKA74689.1 LCP family protein [Arthrobacter sp. FW306-07-I]